MSKLISHQNRSEHHCLKSKDLSLRLTTTINEPAVIVDDVAVFPLYDTTTISDNGTFVWTVRTYFPPVDGITAATLYRNENGTLVPVGDPVPMTGNPFTDVTGGAISPSGTFAFLLDEGPAEGQIRVFSVPDLDLLRTITIPNVSNPDILMIASPHVFLNRYASITYPTSQHNNFVVSLVDLLTGAIVTAPLSAGFSNDGGVVFELCGQIYVSVGTGALDGPAFLDIFVLEADQLIPVEQLVLPSLVTGQSVQVRHGAALLAVATGTANVPGIPPIAGSPSSFPNPFGEPSGIRIFAFDGCRLCLTALKTINSGQRGFGSISFDPTGHFLYATISSPLTTALFTLVTYRLVAGHNCELDRISSVPICHKQLKLQEVDVNLSAPGVVSVDPSGNGRWLIVSGGTFGDPNAPDFPEVDLFRVFYAPCAKFEDEAL